jgi:hypothetical protein
MRCKEQTGHTILASEGSLYQKFQGKQAGYLDIVQDFGSYPGSAKGSIM